MNLLLEKKDHIINKIPGLTPEQKTQVIAYFNGHPSEEGKIDWNKGQKLTFADFEPIITAITKTGKKKVVQRTGIEGLKYNEDYVICFKGKGIVGYVPLNYESSRFLASKYVGGQTGKWCIAYQKDRHYWDKSVVENTIFIFLVNYSAPYKFKKVAITAYEGNRGYDIFDQEDRNFEDKDPNFEIDEKVFPDWLFKGQIIRTFIKEARIKIKESKLGRLDAKVDIDRVKYFPKVKFGMTRKGRLNVSISVDKEIEYEWDEIPTERSHAGYYKAFLSVIERDMFITNDVHFMYFIKDQLPEGTGIYIESNISDLNDIIDNDYNGIMTSDPHNYPTDNYTLLNFFWNKQFERSTNFSSYPSFLLSSYSLIGNDSIQAFNGKFNNTSEERIGDLYIYKEEEDETVNETTFDGYLMRRIAENNTSR